MKKPWKIFITVICSIVGVCVGLFLLLVLGMTIGAHAKYSEFYSLRTKEAKNPGCWDDYVPQGMTFNDDELYYATCGYMKDGTTSRIYTVDKKSGKKNMYLLTSQGEPFAGHTGGLQYSKGNFYLASEQDGVFVFPASELDGSGSAEIGPVIKVNNNSSFVFADENYVYVGEFAHVPAYPCVHDVTYNGQTHTAILSKYNYGDFEHPVAIYAIPDEVQGAVFTDNGSVIVSRSWGITFASYDVYKASSIVKTDIQIDGAPVYFMTEADKVIPSIYFTEDVDIVDGKVITMTEAGANKYFIGKFIFDYYIFSFDLADLEK